MSTPADWDQVEELHPIKTPKSLGEYVSTQTLRRWSKEGLYSHRTGRTVVLETTNRGRMIYTSKERMLAFYRRHSGIKE
jgi:hypothetical protein